MKILIIKNLKDEIKENEFTEEIQKIIDSESDNNFLENQNNESINNLSNNSNSSENSSSSKESNQNKNKKNQITRIKKNHMKTISIL